MFTKQSSSYSTFNKEFLKDKQTNPICNNKNNGSTSIDTCKSLCCGCFSKSEMMNANDDIKHDEKKDELLPNKQNTVVLNDKNLLKTTKKTPNLCCFHRNQPVDTTDDTKDDQNQTPSWFQRILSSTKLPKLFKGEFPLLPCITASITMLLLIKYRHTVGRFISSIFILFGLIIPKFIDNIFNWTETKTYFNDNTTYIDLNNFLCVILFLYGIFMTISFRSIVSISSIKYSILIFFTSVFYGLMFYVMNLFIVIIVTYIGLPYLLYTLLMVKIGKKRHKVFVIIMFLLLMANFTMKIISVVCYKKECGKHMNYGYRFSFDTVSSDGDDSYIGYNFITIQGEDTIWNCDEEYNELCKLFRNELKLQKEYYPIFRDHAFVENFDQFCNLREEDLKDMKIDKKGHMLKVICCN